MSTRKKVGMLGWGSCGGQGALPGYPQQRPVKAVVGLSSRCSGARPWSPAVEGKF